jgi:hypothetical protein
VSRYPSGQSGAVSLAPNSEIITKPQAYFSSVVGITPLSEHWPAFVVPPSGTAPANSTIVAATGGYLGYYTNSTKITIRNYNWQGSPLAPVCGLPSSHGAGSTTVVFEASDDGGANWVSVQGIDSAFKTGNYVVTVPQYSVEPWGRSFSIDSAGFQLVRLRVNDMKSGIWASISGSAEGGVGPVPNAATVTSSVGDHTLRSVETTLNGALQFVQVYCFDTNQAGWWIRGGPWTGLVMKAYVSARGTNFAEVVSTPMDGAAAAVAPAIANAATLNSVIRGFRINCSTALIVRVLITALTTGSVILEVDSAA